MKGKKLGKRLTLNKKTITDLNDRSMGKVNGGNKTGITCGIFCNTVDFSCEVTMCGTCYHTCPPTWCDTECGC